MGGDTLDKAQRGSILKGMEVCRLQIWKSRRGRKKEMHWKTGAGLSAVGLGQDGETVQSVFQAASRLIWNQRTRGDYTSRRLPFSAILCARIARSIVSLHHSGVVMHWMVG